MVEVFKTNVGRSSQAKVILERIHGTYSDYVANFDLDDCDKILRVECPDGMVEAPKLLRLFRDLGFEAEVLPDDASVNALSDP